MGEDRPRLSIGARYRLEVLSRGPRVYGPKDQQIKILARSGLAEPLPGQVEGGPRCWVITEAGRAVMASYVIPPKRPIFRWKRGS